MYSSLCPDIDFIGYFIYLHFKYCPPSQSPLCKTPILSPFLFVSMRLPFHPPTHSNLTALACPSAGSSSLHRIKHLPSHWCQPDEVILCYIFNWSHGFLHVYSWVGGLAPRSSGVPVNWFCCFSYRIAICFSLFIPSPISSISASGLSSIASCEYLHLY